MIPVTFRHALLVGALTLVASFANPVHAASEPAASLEELERQLEAQPHSVELLFQVGRAYYRKGAEGDKSAVDQARKALEELLERDAQHALARVVLGSVYTLKARDAFLPNGKLKWARLGVDTMDEAVAKAPESHEVRWVRALNNFHMPAFMKREALVMEDLEWLWTHRDALGPSSHPSAALVSEFYGRALKKAGRATDARTVWEAGLELDPDPEIQSRLSQLLAQD